MPRRPIPLVSTLALLVALAGCEQPIGGNQNPTGPNDPDLTQQHPATPPPTVIPTAQPVPTTEVATPAPKTPIPTATAVITPVPPGGSVDPSATPSAGATATPTSSPSPTGPYTPTGTASDLAISGDGYFVLSTQRNPIATSDLLFTRYGHFAFQLDTSGSVPMFRLRHVDTAFYVVGYTLAGTKDVGAPLETSGGSGVVLSTKWAGSAVVATSLAVDGDRNPAAASKSAFSYEGRLSIAADAPRGSDGAENQVFVAVTQFEEPAELDPLPGFSGIYRYDEAAGQATTGVAVTGAGRGVGNNVLILGGQLERL